MQIHDCMLAYVAFALKEKKGKEGSVMLWNISMYPRHIPPNFILFRDLNPPAVNQELDPIGFLN